MFESNSGKFRTSFLRGRKGSATLYRDSAVSEGGSFVLESIQNAQPPAGAEGSGWHRYVITQGNNTIVGHRQGSTTSVTLAIEKIMLRLNERRAGKFRDSFTIPPRNPTTSVNGGCSDRPSERSSDDRD